VSGAGRSRADVGPSMWEGPVAAVLVWLLAGALILPAARGAAAFLLGGGWVWPAGGRELVAAVGGLATGDLGAGLTPAQAAAVPAAGLVYAAAAVGLVLLVALTVWAIRWWRANYGSGARSGMADRPQVEEVLGLARLRKVSAVIRPDLYPTGRAAPATPPAGGVS